MTVKQTERYTHHYRCDNSQCRAVLGHVYVNGSAVTFRHAGYDAQLVVYAGVIDLTCDHCGTINRWSGLDDNA